MIEQNGKLMDLPEGGITRGRAMPPASQSSLRKQAKWYACSSAHSGTGFQNIHRHFRPCDPDRTA
jgi:hypothetical protein